MTISSCAALFLSIPAIALIGVIAFNLKSITRFFIQPFKDLYDEIQYSRARLVHYFKIVWRTAMLSSVGFGLFLLITTTKIIPCGQKQATDIQKNVEILADCGCN